MSQETVVAHSANRQESSETSAKPRILFATIAAGGGHVATARAMADAVAWFYPDSFDLAVSDLMLELGMFEQDKQHKEFWRWALAHPQLVRTGQRILDAAPTLTRRTHRLMLRGFARLAAEKLGANPPQLIVANHGWLTVGLTLAQRRFGLSSRVLSFATEPLDASALWAEPRAEHFIVPSTYARDDLIKMGVDPDKIDVVGYPIQRTFLEAPAKAQARAELSMSDRFTCLLSLGGEGVAGRLEPWLEPWLEPLLRAELAVVVMTGRNEELRRQLEPLAARFPALRIEGFTDRMASFVAASDVVIGKAGPASVFETLAVGRPFLAISYAGLNERKVVEFLQRRQLGRLCSDPNELQAAVTRYQEQPELLAAVREGCRALGLREMTEALARYIVEYARHGRPSRNYVGHGLL